MNLRLISSFLKQSAHPRTALTRVALLAATLSCIPGSANGQDFLEPIVVTATRGKSKESDTAYTSTYMGQDFLQQNFRRNIPDALNFTPGVLSQKTTYGHGSPFIRGQTGRGNLLMFDGIRLNNSTWRGGPVQYWNTIDAYAIDHFELVKSQGSVPYGSDAIGGTLNAFSKTTGFREEAEGKFYTHGSAYYEYRSNGDDSHIGRLEGVIGQGGKWGLRAGITEKDFGDIHSSAIGTMRNTGYEESDWDLRFESALNADTTLIAAFQQVDQDDVWRWHRTIYNPGWNHNGHVAAPGSWLANIYDQNRMLGYLKIVSENPRQGALVSRWSATMSYQDTMDLEFQDRRMVAGEALTSTRYQQWQQADISTYGIDLELESPMGPGKWIYGLDYYQDEVDSFAIRDRGLGQVNLPSSRSVADDSTYSLLGVHGQYHWQATEKLRVESGLRYTRADAELGKRWDSNVNRDISAERNWDHTVFSLRAIQDLSQDWSMYGGVSQAFRAPNLADLSGNRTSGSGVEAGGAVNLDPENFLTYEIGTRRSGKTTSLQAAFFYTDIQDIITDVPISNGSSNVIASNGRDGYIYGFEIEGAWQVSQQWLLSGFVAWQEGETTTVRYLGGPTAEEPYSRALPLTASMALRWTHPSQKYWIESRLLAAEKADRLSAADIADVQRFPSGGTPSYVVPMIYSGWQVNDHLLATLGLENISNVDFRHHGSGNNEPGFNAVLGVRTTW
ncbi:MAG: TonB-dependent receptor plug domain-containing protein [Akkermansiaceae bacterium]